MERYLWVLDYFEWILTAVLLAVGYFAGRATEARHYASIREREERFAEVLTFASKYPPEPDQPQQAMLVSGCVVVGSDYFKQYAAGLKSFFGGRLGNYESLLDRARREAILRMKEQAHQLGYRLIINVKLESSNISGGQRGALPAVEAMAYGTALKPLEETP